MKKKLFLFSLWIPLLMSFNGFECVAQFISPIKLKCEYRVDPLGIDVEQPSLSWLLESSASNLRDEGQTAYHVLVASTPEKLGMDEGDLWNSGLVESVSNTQVLYKGKKLLSFDKCFWKVKVRNKKGELSSWSKTARWEMGVLQNLDWTGDWIGKQAAEKVPHRQMLNGYASAGAVSDNEVKWIQIDLGKPGIFEKFVIHPALPMEHPTGNPTPRNPGFGFPLRFRIDVSNDPLFRKFTTLVDQTKDDFVNPREQIVEFYFPKNKSRYVRMTATKLWNSNRGKEPYYFCLGEFQVMLGGVVLSEGKQVVAMDGVENSGWNANKLTDGFNLIGEVEKNHEALLLRKTFNLNKNIKSARIYISGLGYYELYINGTKVGDHVLDPGFTDYTKRVQYTSYDVTDYLRESTNAIGVMLAGGWYDLPTPDAWGFQVAPWSAPPKLLMNMIVEFMDGTNQIIDSDQSWKVSTGPIVFSCVRGGETYDANKEKPGWNTKEYDDHSWTAAKVVPPPTGKLVSQQNPPIRKVKEIKPISISEPKPGIYVYDMGVNMAGWVRFSLSAPQGATVSLLHNEHLNEDGTVRFGPHTWWHYGPYQTDRYIFKGEGEETYEPRFTYHGFRYVQITGLPTKPKLQNLVGIQVNTDPQPVGEFSCSNEDINKVQELILRTQLNNLHSIPTDCPHREKIGWMGDGLVTTEEAIYNFDMMTFYIKWFHDMMDEQEPDGHVPPIVPNPGWNWSTSAKSKEGEVPAFSDPWWGGNILITPARLYQYYGDDRFIAEGYHAMKAYVDWIGTKSKDHIVVANLADWVEPAYFNEKEITPKEQVGTSAYYYFARLLSQWASMLNYPSDEKRYIELATQILNKYNNTFFNAETGFYDNDSQLAQIIPLAFNMVPEGKESLVERNLIDLIVNKYNSHLNTGFVGTPLLFELLTQRGYSELAYTIATQEDTPGWFYMLRNGATTIWEVWDAIQQIDHSRNHPAFGSIGAWYYQSLAGIQADPSGPGFKKFIIKPEVVGDLIWAKASYQSMHGNIISDWKREGNKFELKINVPINTTAKVYLPAESMAVILENGQDITKSNQIIFLFQERDRFIFEVGSGSYHFSTVLRSK